MSQRTDKDCACSEKRQRKKVFGGDLCEFYIGFITDDEWKNAAYPVYGR